MKLRTTWLWVIINLIITPFVGFAVLLISSAAMGGANFNRFELIFWLQLVPVVLLAGACCGIPMGILQGLSMPVQCTTKARWVIATTLGIAVDAVLIYCAWQLSILAKPSELSPALATLAYAGFIFLAVFHGCSLGVSQWWMAFRVNQASTTWPWLTGIAWSLLTPFPYVYMYNYVISLRVSSISPKFGEFTTWYLPLLLLSLPYVSITTLLWRRVQQQVQTTSDQLSP